jgi:hypothetical protein
LVETTLLNLAVMVSETRFLVLETGFKKNICFKELVEIEKQTITTTPDQARPHQKLFCRLR